MTVASQIKQTRASLQGCKATLESFAAIEENPINREVYKEQIGELDGVLQGLESRIRTLEFQEPQYKGL